MSVKKFLICSTLEWDSLTAQQQSEYEDHFETLVLFFAAKDLFIDSSGDDYIVEHLGESYEETISSRQRARIDLNGGMLIFPKHSNFIINDDYASNYTLNLSDNGYCSVEFNNVTFNVVKNKSQSNRSTVMIDNDRAVFLNNCTFNLNSFRCNAIAVMTDSNSLRCVVYRCIFKNSSNDVDVGGVYLNHNFGARCLMWVVNCTFINMKHALHNQTGSYTPTLNYYNNYFDCFGAEVVGPAQYNVDHGGNVSSSSVSLNDAFVDHVGGNLTPTELLKVAIASLIPEDTGGQYSGAIYLQSFSISNVLKRNRIINNKIRNLVLEI